MTQRFIFPIGGTAESVRTQIGAVGPAPDPNAAPPGVGDVLTWDGTAWVPGPGGGGGGVTSVGGTAPIASSGGATPTISISAATTLADGSMSAADKLKLDGIAAGASIAGTIAANEIAFGNGIDSIGGSPFLTYNPSTQDLTVGDGTPHSIRIGPYGYVANPIIESLNSMNINIANFGGALGLQAGNVDLVLIGGDDGGGESYLQTQAGVRLEVQARATVRPAVDNINALTVRTAADAEVLGVDTTVPAVRLASELQSGGGPGTAGQVLTSGGPGVAPTWQAGGGGVTGAALTTDATPTTVVTLTPMTDSTTTYEAKVTGRKQGAAEAISYGVAATYIESGGTVALVGSDQLWLHETTPAAVSAALQINGSDVEVVVTGNTPVAPTFTDPVTPPVPSGATWTVGTLGGEDFTDLATALADVNVVDGDLLSLSAETFTVAATISVSKQVTIRGQGIGTTVLQTAATAADPVTMMTISVSNVTLQDLTMQQRKTTNTTVENCVTINAGAGSTGHFLEGVRLETMELGITIQSDGWQMNNCQLYYSGATNQTAFLAIIYRSVGSGIVANTQVGHGVSTTTRSFLIRANGGANLLGGYLRFTNITLLPGELSTSQFVICDAFSESGPPLQLVVDNNNVNEQSVFVALFVDKANLLNFIDYVALYDNTISGTHGGTPVGCKGAFAVDGTAALFPPPSMGTTQFFVSGNTIGVTTFRAGWSTIMDTGLGYSASQLALAGWDSTYYSGSPNLTFTPVVTADWDWTATVTKQEAP
jgi:hypothetical protein